MSFNMVPFWIVGVAHWQQQHLLVALFSIALVQPLCRAKRFILGQKWKSMRASLADILKKLTGRRARTHIGIIQDPGHAEPWITAMSEPPGYLRPLEYSQRWGIEPMFSDFKSRGFGIENTQLRYADRLDRLILVMALALYVAVSTGQWDAVHHATPSEKKPGRST